MKYVKAFGIILFIGVTVFVALTLFLAALFGGASWLIALWFVLFVLAVGIILYRKKSRALPIAISMALITLVISLILYLGASPRPLLPGERREIQNHLHSRYGDRGFKIVSATSSNEPIRDYMQLFSYRTFQWENIEATVKDRQGCTAQVTGTNQGFGNVTKLTEEYGIVRVIYDNRDVFDDKMEEAEARHITRVSDTDYMLVKVTVNYSHTDSYTFQAQEKARQQENMLALEHKVLKSKYCAPNVVIIRVRYILEDSTEMYSVSRGNIQIH